MLGISPLGISTLYLSALEDRDGVLARNARELIKKDCEGVTSLEVVDEALNGDASAGEHGCAARRSGELVINGSGSEDMRPRQQEATKLTSKVARAPNAPAHLRAVVVAGGTLAAVK